MSRKARGVGHVLWLSGAVGSTQLFYSANDHGVVENAVRQQAVVGEVMGGVDFPLTDRFGLGVRVGLRGYAGTESPSGFIPGISFSIVRDGFLWGFQGSLIGYVRL